MWAIIVRDTNRADIVLPLESKPYGEKGYTAKDPEGCTWTFGSYNLRKQINE